MAAAYLLTRVAAREKAQANEVQEVFGTLARMSGTDIGPLVQVLEYSSRLEFLYKIVEDTQNTIRFIDTKAAFCVTLLSAMAAGALQVRHEPTLIHRILFAVFMVSVAVSVLICLRTIFPTIKPHGLQVGARGPKFFITHNRRHQWILHTLKNDVGSVLSETHESYVAKFAASSDADLLSSMCDEVLMISLIRQIKSDRLHAAMYSVVGALAVFVVLMLV